MSLPPRGARSRASYAKAIEWVALNDADPADSLATVAGFQTTTLVADLWGKRPETVAADVLSYRSGGDK